MSDNLACLLQDEGITFTALDLGASGEVYEAFQPLLPFSHLIEVDADERDFENRESIALKHTRVREAITENEEADALTLFLTKFPHCSSSLPPNAEMLKNFCYSDFFEVESTIEVRATSLNRLAKRLETSFDWIKLDTQGTETRIIKSLSRELLSKLLIVDVELGVNEHYCGQDTITGFHDLMMSSNFKLNGMLQTQSRPRVRRDDLTDLEKLGTNENELHKWPTALEMRYVRTIDHAEPIDCHPRLVKLWAINYCLEDYGHCYYLSQRLRESESNVRLAGRLEQLAVSKIESKVAQRRRLSRRLQTRGLKLIDRWMS